MSCLPFFSWILQRHFLFFLGYDLLWVCFNNAQTQFQGFSLNDILWYPFLRDGSLLSIGTSVFEVKDPIHSKASIHILSMHVFAPLNSSSYFIQTSSTSALHPSFSSFEQAIYSCPCCSISHSSISFSILSSSNYRFSAFTLHICHNSQFSASSYFIL